MPIQHFHKTSTQVVALWRIREEESVLVSQLSSLEKVPESLKHPHKRLEFIASRLLTQLLLKEFNHPYAGIYKDEFGKPYLTNSHLHISQSHSYPYVAVIVDAEKNVGIDIEQKKEKLYRIASRVFSEAELENAGNDLTKLCILWCAKEALIKLYGQKDLHLKEEIAIHDLTFSSQNFSGRILKKEHEKLYPLQYLVQEDLVLVFNP
jgi:phosphopantetheinyl transferase